MRVIGNTDRFVKEVIVVTQFIFQLMVMMSCNYQYYLIYIL
jgi:hypothetical protein